MENRREINIKVGQHLKDAREAAGFTQERFAEMIDLGPKHVSAIERGAAGLSLPVLMRTCRALSISSDTLLFGSAGKNDVTTLTEQLERLTPDQFAIVQGVFGKLLEAFTLGKK